MRTHLSRCQAPRGHEEAVLGRVARLPQVLALLIGMLAAYPAQAQTTDAPAVANLETMGQGNTSEPDFLKALPHPPDQPASLLAPAPPLGPPPPNLEEPYFQTDPLLDPPVLGLPGWFATMEAGILAPHLVNQERLPLSFPAVSTTLTGNVPGIPPGVTTSTGQNFISPPAAGAPFSVNVGVNAARLNWTVAPRFEVGYRLPSGFGGFSLSYRFLTAQGSQDVIGTDGPATLTSRLIYNIGDLDWVSHEYTPWRLWEMRIRLGLRYLNDYWDSQANVPFAAAAAGSMIADQRTTNSNWTLGPHVAVDVRRHLNFWGLSILGFLDLGEGWGRVRQNYFATVTSGTNGLPQTATESISTSAAVPTITTRLGLNWDPPAYANVHLFVGYQLDYFWNTGRMGNFTEYGYFFDSGILLRGEWNY